SNANAAATRPIRAPMRALPPRLYLDAITRSRNAALTGGEADADAAVAGRGRAVVVAREAHAAVGRRRSDDGGGPLRRVVVRGDVLERQPERRRRRIAAVGGLGRGQIHRRHPELRLLAVG